MRGFAYCFVGVLVAWLATSGASADDTTYSQKKCEESTDCRLLSNEKADYSVEAEVLEVIDADTLKVRMFVLPGLTYELSVRSRGVDAPEIFRPACDREKQLGLAAAESVKKKFGPGRWVVLRDLENDKYGGRVVAQIDRWDSDRFKSLSEELLEKQGEQAVPMIDGQDYNWCEG